MTATMIATGAPRAGSLTALPVDPANHTMGDALLPYLKLKVHSLAQHNDWSRIHVVGEYDRNAVVSDIEKDGKRFNWQRPTALVEGRELVVKCFPGTDYVQHYALIISTYLAMTGRYRGHVTYELPTADLCADAVARVEVDVADVDAVVTGWALPHLVGDDGWTTSPDGYAWKRARAGSATLLFLGFLHSIWGDVAGRVVTHLAALGASRVIYIGKVGALDPTMQPNTLLASGRMSLVGGRQVDWDDVFADVDVPLLTRGMHVTSSSTLFESQAWLHRHRHASFVDPEIGPMGAAATGSGIPFGYLHVVSNNLARTYEATLANERQAGVLNQREQLLDVIRNTLQTTVASFTGAIPRQGVR